MNHTSIYKFPIIGKLKMHRNNSPFSVPYIREKNSNKVKFIVVNSGGNAKLNCQIRAGGQDTKLRYNWFKRSQVFGLIYHIAMKGESYRYLKIKEAKKEAAGVYTCVAMNNCGQNHYTMHLTVKGM